MSRTAPGFLRADVENAKMRVEHRGRRGIGEQTIEHAAPAAPAGVEEHQQRLGLRAGEGRLAAQRLIDALGDGGADHARQGGGKGAGEERAASHGDGV